MKVYLLWDSTGHSDELLGVYVSVDSAKAPMAGSDWRIKNGRWGVWPIYRYWVEEREVTP